MHDADKLKIEALSKRAADWRGALVILTSEFFVNDRRVWKYVDLDHESIAFTAILEDGTFSGGERRLLEIAASIFAPQHSLNLWSTFGYLDDQATAIAIDAIRSFCREGV